MSRSIKFKNNTFLDASSIVYNRMSLKSRLDRLDDFHCQIAETENNNYCVFGGIKDNDNQYDRRVMLYIFCGNGCANHVGVIVLNNGELHKHYTLCGDHTPKISFYTEGRI